MCILDSVLSSHGDTILHSSNDFLIRFWSTFSHYYVVTNTSKSLENCGDKFFVIHHFIQQAFRRGSWTNGWPKEGMIWYLSSSLSLYYYYFNYTRTHIYGRVREKVRLIRIFVSFEYISENESHFCPHSSHTHAHQHTIRREKWRKKARFQMLWNWWLPLLKIYRVSNLILRYFQ